MTVISNGSIHNCCRWAYLCVFADRFLNVNRLIIIGMEKSLCNENENKTRIADMDDDFVEKFRSD